MEKSGLVWLALNTADALLTKQCLAEGMRELNPLAGAFQGNSLVAFKLGTALAVLIVLVLVGRGGLLKWLNIGMGLVVLWGIAMLLMF